MTPHDDLKARAAPPHRWLRFIAIGAAVMALGLSVAFLLLVFLDPFGRLGIRSGADLDFPNDERHMMVSRALDPDFNSVIIGNSTSMPLMPRNLDQLTGHKFVSLSISGSNAPASISTLRFFLSHHPDARAVVVALFTDTWCGPEFDEVRPFPFWLYSTLPRYLMGLARNASFDLIRTTFASSKRAHSPGNVSDVGKDGYHTYIGPFDRPEYTEPDLIRRRLGNPPRPVVSMNQRHHFPALDHLETAVRGRDSLFYVLLWTPRFLTYIPEPGSAAEQTDRACKLRLEGIAAKLPNARIIDWSDADRPENHDAVNFLDVIHYRRQLANRVEQDVAMALRDNS